MSLSRNILFALSTADRTRFVPGRPLEEEFAPGALWVDVAGITPDDWRQLLVKSAPEILVTAWDTPAFPETLARQPDLPLRYVCHLTGGVRFLPRSLLERGVLVSNWGECVSHAVAEHAVLLTLATLRNLPLWRAFMPRLPADRYTELRTCSLRGKRVGLHGFGAVARQIARLLKPFGAEIRAYSAGVPKTFYEQNEVLPVRSLEELFSGSEVIIECEALTSLTRGSVTEGILELLPEDAIFVNVGRGVVVDERALARLAKEGRVRVGLDVFEDEPLPATSEFYRIPNALLSPHIAGPTADTFSVCGDFAIRNLNRYFKGEPVDGLVTLEAYDRAS